MSGLTNNKRGVMILLNNNFQHEIGRVIKDPNGNFLMLEITIKGKKIIPIYSKKMRNLIMKWQLYVVTGI